MGRIDVTASIVAREIIASALRDDGTKKCVNAKLHSKRCPEGLSFPHVLERCNRRIYYPLNGKWHIVRCAYWKHRDNWHGDINWTPFCTEQDAQWFEIIYFGVPLPGSSVE